MIFFYQNGDEIYYPRDCWKGKNVKEECVGDG